MQMMKGQMKGSVHGGYVRRCVGSELGRGNVHRLQAMPIGGLLEELLGPL